LATRLIIGTPAKPPAWRPLILADAGPGRMDAVATGRHPVEGVVVAAAQVDFHLDEGEEVTASVEPSGPWSRCAMPAWP
jgi:hypothetical protein